MAVVSRKERASAVRFIKWASGLSLVLGLFQLLLGCDPLILIACLASGFVIFVPIYLYGMEKTGGILYLFLWLAFFFISFFVKTVLLQSIDSNLFNPPLTFSVLLAGSIAFSVAGVGSYYFKIGHMNAVRPLTNPRIIHILGIIFFIIGIAGVILRIISPLNSTPSNISLFFIPYAQFGLVCELSSIIISSNRRRIFSLTGWFMIIILVSLGVAANSKTGILTAGAAFFISAWAFRAKIKWPIILASILALVFASEFLFPAVHIVRAQRERLNLAQMGMATLETTGALITGDDTALAEKDALTMIENASNDLYRNEYFGAPQVWLDRFTVVGYIDAIGRRVSFDGPFFGPAFVLGQTYNVLPRQLNPNKQIGKEFSPTDQILQALGMENKDSVSYGTVPMPIELFVSDGFIFIFLVGIPVIFLLVAEINGVSFQFSGNIWAVCMVLYYGFSFYVGNYFMYIFIVLREIPFNFLMFSGCGALATIVNQGLEKAGRASPNMLAKQI